MHESAGSMQNRSGFICLSTQAGYAQQGEAVVVRNDPAKNSRDHNVSLLLSPESPCSTVDSSHFVEDDGDGGGAGDASQGFQKRSRID